MTTTKKIATVKDYSKLREHQIELSKDERSIQLGGGSIIDNNPVGYTGRTYDELTRIKMPLILDIVGRTPWSIEEVLGAFHGPIKGLVFEYARKRPGYQDDDAESIGMQAVLDALYTDRGISWFAGHCYERVKAAIKRGAKSSGLIRAGEVHKQWRDHITSANEAFGESEGTIGETLDGDYRLATRERCGDYKIIGGKKVFVSTCDKGIVDRGLSSARVCDRCGGTGLIVKFEDRRTSLQPSVMADDHQRKEEVEKIWRILAADIPEKQLEIMVLLLGLDWDGGSRTPTQVSEYLKAKYGMGSKNFVVTCRDKVLKKFRHKQAVSVELTEAIDRVLSSLGEDTI